MLAFVEMLSVLVYCIRIVIGMVRLLIMVYGPLIHALEPPGAAGASTFLSDALLIFLLVRAQLFGLLISFFIKVDHYRRAAR